ncbi:MAG: tripartite tricarboxylate transporter TctB family protein [Pseudomonadota bacterium]
MDAEFDTEGTADQRQSRTFSDWLVPLVIFAFCGVVTYFALNLDTAPAIVIGEAMQPRSFPIFLMGLIALLNAVLIYQLVSGSRMPHPRQMPQTWVTMLLMIVFYGLTTYVDMFVGLMVVIFVMSLVWGERRYWLAAMVAVVTPVTIFFLFDLVLKIRFPRGILTELYYG